MIEELDEWDLYFIRHKITEEKLKRLKSWDQCVRETSIKTVDDLKKCLKENYESPPAWKDEIVELEPISLSTEIIARILAFIITPFILLPIILEFLVRLIPWTIEAMRD